jgi:VanZ family protein
MFRLWIVIPMNKTAIRVWGPVLLCALAIFFLSVLPGSVFPKFRIRNLDKMVHLVEYFFLAFFLFRGIAGTKTGRPAKINLFLSLILCSVYGIVLELIQSFIPGRSGGMDDVFVNLAGASLGIWTAGILYKKAGLWQK